MAQTVVHNADGTLTAFGSTSMSSLLESEEKEVRELVDALTDLELKGLVHEFNLRLRSTGAECESLQQQLDMIVEMCDLLFFGLTRESTVKDLDKAYRKLAKIMHPDKNGSTEEANEAFLNLKKRYERLKKRIQERKEREAKQKNAPKVPPREDLSPSKERARMVPKAMPTEPIVLPDASAKAPLSEEEEEEEDLDRAKLDDACWKILRRTKAFMEKNALILKEIDDTKQELVQLQRRPGKGCGAKDSVNDAVNGKSL